MNVSKLTGLFVLSPFLTFAHGEQVLFSFGINLSVLTLFLVFVLKIQDSRGNKLILSIVFVLSFTGTFIYTSSIPFAKNESLINLLNAIVPITSTLTTYFILKKQNRHT